MIPSTASDISPAWLTAVLRDAGAISAATVVGVRPRAGRRRRRDHGRADPGDAQLRPRRAWRAVVGDRQAARRRSRPTAPRASPSACTRPRSASTTSSPHERRSGCRTAISSEIDQDDEGLRHRARRPRRLRRTGPTRGHVDRPSVGGSERAGRTARSVLAAHGRHRLGAERRPRADQGALGGVARPVGLVLVCASPTSCPTARSQPASRSGTTTGA